MRLAVALSSLVLACSAPIAEHPATATPSTNIVDVVGAIAAARAKGAPLPASLEARAAELNGPMFDSRLDAIRINKTPGPGKDPIAESAENHYGPGVSSKDVEGYADKFPLNSRITKE